MDGGQGIVIQIFALVLAVCFHEAAHGWVAWRNGDATAKLAGRITLNPIPHIDLFGTILFPAILMITHAPILIGWAKPVPVNPRNFTNPKRGFAQVSIAGPGSNMLLAVLAAVALKIWTTLDPGLHDYLYGYLQGDGGLHGVSVALPLALFLLQSVYINVVLGVFNCFPIPPLDGGHFLMGVLPPRQGMALAKIEPYGMFIVLGLAYLGVINLFVRPDHLAAPDRSALGRAFPEARRHPGCGGLGCGDSASRRSALPRERSHPGVAAGAGCVTQSCHASPGRAAGDAGSTHEPFAAGDCRSCHDLALLSRGALRRGAPRAPAASLRVRAPGTWRSARDVTARSCWRRALRSPRPAFSTARGTCTRCTSRPVAAAAASPATTRTRRASRSCCAS